MTLEASRCEAMLPALHTKQCYAGDPEMRGPFQESSISVPMTLDASRCEAMLPALCEGLNVHVRIDALSIP